MPVEVLQQLLKLWLRMITAELDRPCRHADGLEGSSELERIADHRTPSSSAKERPVGMAELPDGAATAFCCDAESNDEQRALLPQLFSILDPTERRLLWNLYLREHPLNPRQIQKLMGLSREEQQRMEGGAIRKLQEAAKGWLPGSRA